jgi:pimeloyl-ACP methyl ester carboxylesterase
MPDAAREIELTLTVDGRTVPAVAWLPAGGGVASAPCPFVLLGHGGTFAGGGNKRSEGQVRLARLLTERHGVAAVAIDMPGAGDRPDAAQEAERRASMTIEDALRDLWTDRSIDETVADWQAVVDHVQHAVGLGDAPLGYFGLSGGTMYGLPLVARDPRIVVAVLGLNGAVPMMLKHAPAVRCRVLYIHNLDDQFGDAQSGFELFAALGTSDKRLHAFPGTHGAIPPDELEYVAAFLAQGVSR